MTLLSIKGETLDDTLLEMNFESLGLHVVKGQRLEEARRCFCLNAMLNLSYRTSSFFKIENNFSFGAWTKLLIYQTRNSKWIPRLDLYNFMLIREIISSSSKYYCNCIRFFIKTIRNCA